MTFNKLLVFLLFSLWNISCTDTKSKDVKTSLEGPFIEVDIVQEAGRAWTEDGNSFIASPVNVGKYRELGVLILSDIIAKDQAIEVKPVGAMKTISGGNVNHFILAVPSSDQLRTVDITSFSDLATTYSSAKWIIEQYMLSRNGLGSVQSVSWEDEHFVFNKLLNNNY